MSEIPKLKCSFCAKPQDQVKKLIAGPEVYICDKCVNLSNEIMDEEFGTDANLFRDLNLTPVSQWLKKKGWEAYHAGGELYYKTPFVNTNKLLTLCEALSSQIEKELTQ